MESRIWTWLITPSCDCGYKPGSMQNRLFVLMKAGPRSTLITAIITKATGKLREEGRVRKTLAPPLFWPISLSLGIFFDSPQLSVSSTFKSFDLQNTPAWQGTNLVKYYPMLGGKERRPKGNAFGKQLLFVRNHFLQRFSKALDNISPGL